MIGRRSLVKGIGSAIGAIGVSTPFIRAARSQPRGLTRVQGVYAAPGLSFSALFLADRLGLWAKNGIGAELKQVQGGPLSMAALTNREAAFAGVASTDPIVGWGRGIKTLAIGAFTGSLTMQFTARNDWMARVGLSPQSPLAAKLKAFKGARIGASTIGGGPAQYTRYLARANGIDPERDMKILAVGFGAARMAALRTNQVDITVGDAPEADQVELEGFGALFLNCAREVPIFQEFSYTVALVTPAFASAQPETVRGIARALGEANDMFHADFDQVVDALKPQFTGVPAKAIERSLERDRDSFPRGCRMTQKMWDNNIEVSIAAKMISSPLPTQEGELWTNRYIA
jgi:NitT/TauT family transport system substrate-binding protein